jgi:hypothetical protein
LATSVNTSLPMWLEGCTYDGDAGNDLRNSGITAFFYDEGIVAGSVIGVLGGVAGGAGLEVSAGGGMSVSVQPGSFVVPNSASPASGGYAATLPQSANLTVQTADPSNPRIDIVVAYVSDAGTSSSFGAIEIITGTAAGSPSAPAAPANSITLAQISVPALTTTITTGLITGTRPFTTATGGILVAAPGAVTGYVGMAGFDAVNARFYHNTNAGGSKQFRVLPWAPVVQAQTADWSLPSASPSVILSAGITTDGYTDIKVTTHITGISQLNPSTAQAVFTVWLDGTQICETDLMTNSGDTGSISHLGYTDAYCTSSSTGDTPSAGSHTVSWKALGVGGGHTIAIRAYAGAPAYLRVEPVIL